MILVSLYLVHNSLELKSQAKELALLSLEPLNKFLEQNPEIYNENYFDEHMAKVMKNSIDLTLAEGKHVDQILVALPLFIAGFYFIFTGIKESEFWELFIQFFRKL
ncbi:MAG: hypothetical protein ACOYEH_09450 [Caldicoprobacterales bacterium]